MKCVCERKTKREKRNTFHGIFSLKLFTHTAFNYISAINFINKVQNSLLYDSVTAVHQAVGSDGTC